MWSLKVGFLSRAMPRYLAWFLYSSCVLLIIRGVMFWGNLLVNVIAVVLSAFSLIRRLEKQVESQLKD